MRHRLIDPADEAWFRLICRVQYWADRQEEKYRARRYMRCGGTRLTSRELQALEERRARLLAEHESRLTQWPPPADT